MGKQGQPKQKPRRSSRKSDNASLAAIITDLMKKKGHDPKNNKQNIMLAFRMGLKSGSTLTFILKGKTQKPHQSTVNKLVAYFCQNDAECEAMIRQAAHQPSTKN